MASEPVPKYKALSAEERTALAQDGGAVRVKRVHYQVADGHRSYVDIPVEQYNVDTVTKALDEAATNHLDVMSIQGPMLTPPEQ